MIKLTPPQKKNAEDSAKKLTSRASSHLKGWSYSAGKNFAFVNGYSELLVMIYEDCLFLKMEGHSAFSYAHLKAWNEKRKTGAGSMNNPALVRQDRHPLGHAAHAQAKDLASARQSAHVRGGQGLPPECAGEVEWEAQGRVRRGAGRPHGHRARQLRQGRPSPRPRRVSTTREWIASSASCG